MPDVIGGDVWQHKNGNYYYVLGVSNTKNVREDHPPDVVYCTIVNQRIDFTSMWTRRLSDWDRSFTHWGCYGAKSLPAVKRC